MCSSQIDLFCIKSGKMFQTGVTSNEAFDYIIQVWFIDASLTISDASIMSHLIICLSWPWSVKESSKNNVAQRNYSASNSSSMTILANKMAFSLPFGLFVTSEFLFFILLGIGILPMFKFFLKVVGIKLLVVCNISFAYTLALLYFVFLLPRPTLVEPLPSQLTFLIRIHI